MFLNNFSGDASKENLNTERDQERCLRKRVTAPKRNCFFENDCNKRKKFSAANNGLKNEVDMLKL